MSEYLALDELKARLDSLRPIAPERLAAIREKFRLEWTYHSNALEGNPLTLGETSFFIREGLTSKGKPLSAYLEASNHIEALDYLESVVRDKVEITPFLIRQFHSMLFKRIDKIKLGAGPERKETAIVGGEYKKEDNHVIRLDGKILQFTEPFQVPAEVEALTKWYSTEGSGLHPVARSALFHHRLVRIHPFLDGNGRVSRLLMNTILMQNGFTPAIIPVEEKQRYLEALQAADDGSYDLLLSFIETQAAKTLRLTLDVIEGREAFDFKDLARLVKNIADQAHIIETDLGKAVQPAEVRSSQTAGQINTHVAELIRKHIGEVTSPNTELNFSTTSATPSNSALLQEFAARGPRGHVPSAIYFNMNGIGKRFTPNGHVEFFVVSNKFEVALAAASFVGKFNNNNVEEITNIPGISTSKTGSIYIEEWDWPSVDEFVLSALKRFYMAWNEEMERRKLLIEREEAEIEQKRSR
jgi:Fic family protein